MKTQLLSIAFLSFFLSLNLWAQDSEFHLDEIYEIAANGVVHLNSEDADVRISGSDRTDVRVKIDRVQEVTGFRTGDRRFSVEVEETGGDLYITERKSGSVNIAFGMSRTRYDIDIQMPRGVSLKVEGEDDDYVISNIDGEISIEAEDGDIEIFQTNSKRIDLRLEDGDLRLEGGTGELFLNIEDGDVDIRRGKFEAIDIDTEDGDISIETALTDGGEYQIVADDADIDFIVLSGGGEFYVSRDDGRVMSSKAFQIEDEREHRVLLNLPGGEAAVEIRVEDGRVRLSKD